MGGGNSGGGVDWNPTDSSIGTNLNKAHNNQNMNMHPEIWNTDISKSSLETGAGTPWGAGGMYQQMGDTSQLAPGMGIPNAERKNSHDQSSPSYVAPSNAPTISNTPLASAFNYSTPQRSNTAEDQLRQSYMNSMNPNYGFTFQGTQNPQGAFNQLTVQGPKGGK